MKKLLVIGAGFLQAFVIDKATQLGYYVISVDGNPNAEGFRFADEYEVIDIMDQEACLEYAREKQINGVMTAATDFGVITAAYIAQEMGLPGLDYKVAKLVKNKYLIRKRLYEEQVDDTDQVYEVSQATDVYGLSKKICFPVMVKPCDGSGSRGASKVCSPQELFIACKLAIHNSVTQRAELERFIDGQEYGVESLVENGNIHVMAVMKKWMTEPPYYAELGHAIPSGLSTEMEMRIKECVTKAIQAIGINFGAVNMDLLITDSGQIYIIDVGARMGGNLIGSHIVHIGTGIDYLANLIYATMGERVDMRPGEMRSNVVTRLLALSPGKIMKLPDIERIAKKYNVEIYHHLHIGDEISQYHTNLDGYGYIVASKSDMISAEHNAERAKDAIDRGIVRR